ncbi:hypothetical protein [Paraburkholderia hospita]|jgi:hypothetical protein|nr:hypothetical protein [Paraburkholderia hospita]EUC19028.1 hypothetical protein PMI06_002898 [Burkholderia sp. BT03]SKC65088.1 hypothetical protein SAMN06266956_1442 [Paraburkholderia hospita]SKC90500.1 hypothetical protein SAMN05445504_5964 [Burkholderia sp. CF099]
MARDPASHDNSTARPDNAPRGEPEPPDTSKDLPELPDPVEVGEDG